MKEIPSTILVGWFPSLTEIDDLILGSNPHSNKIKIAFKNLVWFYQIRKMSENEATLVKYSKQYRKESLYN